MRSTLIPWPIAAALVTAGLVLGLAFSALAQADPLSRWSFGNAFELCADPRLAETPFEVSYCTGPEGTDPATWTCFVSSRWPERCAELHPSAPSATLVEVALPSSAMRRMQAFLGVPILIQARAIDGRVVAGQGVTIGAYDGPLEFLQPPGIRAIVLQQRRELGLPVPAGAP